MIVGREARLVACSIATLAIGNGCVRGRSVDERPRPGGDVVAVVDRTPIRRHEVEAYGTEHGQSARDALTALEDRRLLADHAAASGVRLDESYLRKRLLVQLLLRRIERENGEALLSDSQIEPFRESAREALRRESAVSPPLPPDETEVNRRATDEAIVALRRNAVNRIVVSGRRRETIEYREATVREMFGRDALFEGVR